jgi:hypothetical protein
MLRTGSIFSVKKPITPAERIARMQAMFDKEYAILAEDYHFFTRNQYLDILQDASKRQNKALRTSGKRTSQPNPKLN